MLDPTETLQPINSPASEHFSTATTVGGTVSGSAGNPPQCLPCRRIFNSLSEDDQEHKWPPMGDLEKPCHGWPGLADIMVKNGGFQSFQAFRDLHIKSLLYYQVELVKIREELHRIEWRNHTERHFARSDKLCKRAEWLLDPKTKASPRDEEYEQILKITEMRTVLKEYSKQFDDPRLQIGLANPMALEGEAMLLYTKINELPEPESFGVDNLLKWLKRERSNHPISGPGGDSWGELNAGDKARVPLWKQFQKLVRTIFWEKKTEKVDLHQLDLVVPRREKDVDRFTSWVFSEGVPFWEAVCVKWNNFLSNEDTNRERLPRWCGLSDLRRKESTTSQESEKSGHSKEEKTEIVIYHANKLIAFTTFVATVVASLLPIVAIVALSKVHKMRMILGLIALFTGVFTMGLTFLTPSGTSRTDIFTASAA
jgi:hypothetical protein